MFQNDDARHNYLPVDMDAKIDHSMIKTYLPVDIDAETEDSMIQSNINSISELRSALELEERRSSSFRRSWMKDRKRTRSALLKLRILTNDTRQMVFENAFQDRQCCPPRIKTIEDIEAALKNEKIWSVHFFKGWMKERSQRQRLELLVALFQ